MSSKKGLKIFFGYLFFLSIGFHSITAQYTSKKIKTKHQTYTDSLKQVDYKYVFPILGQGAYKKGFDIPYPAAEGEIKLLDAIPPEV